MRTERTSTLRWGAVLVALSLFLSGCGGGGGSGNGGDDPGPDPTPTEHDWTPIAAKLDSYMPEVITGYVFALMVDSEIVYLHSAGDLERFESVGIASASKALTSTAILTLVRDGLLDLDAPIATYLGGEVEWPAEKSAITMRMLLNHTSGLQPDVPCLSDAYTRTLKSCVQDIADAPLAAPPGTGFYYGGSGYQVAALAAEQVSGERFNQFIQDRLANPLGLTSIRFHGINPPAGGGATANAVDYLAFMRVVMDHGRYQGTQFLPPALGDLPFQNQIEGVPITLPPIALKFTAYSFGWYTTDPARVGAGSSGPELSDPGLFGTVPWVDEDKNYAAVLLIKSSVQTGVVLWDELRPMVLGELNR